jgi:hypothetical protein
MGLLDQFAAFAVTRMRGRLDRPGGRPVDFSASGFWLATTDGHLLFVTNRHNVDPKLKHGAGTSFALAAVELQVRRALDGKVAFHPVTNLSSSVWFAPSADCALIADPRFAGAAMLDRGKIFREANLAEPDVFPALQITDGASFIGYPGFRGRAWWDQVADLPIARLATIASIPTTEFRNEAIKTTDVMLVSGLSFSGSSGSPVLNHPKGLPPGGDVQDGSHVPSKIIGIMSGHFWENPDDPPEMFRHSGLSYLTKSTAILELIATARRSGFERAG